MTKKLSKRNSSSKARIENEKHSDITLAEFADAGHPGIKGRLRKSKLIPEASFHDCLDPTVEISDDVEEPEVLKRRVSHRKKGAKLKKNSDDDNQYTEYPLQIWLLLAEYIRPEDIKSFSLICKATLSVVNTPLFWIRLYKRYYKKAIDIPKNLSPECLEIHRGLKRNVVRSLYYLYPPFASDLQRRFLPLETIKGQVILSVWKKPIGPKQHLTSCWKYHITLCNKTTSEMFSKEKHVHDINYNKEKGCSILELIMDDFILFPRMVGIRLLSATLKHHELSLILSCDLASWNSLKGGTNMEMNLKLCFPPRVMPWWHPAYCER